MERFKQYSDKYFLSQEFFTFAFKIPVVEMVSKDLCSRMCRLSWLSRLPCLVWSGSGLLSACQLSSTSTSQSPQDLGPRGPEAALGIFSLLVLCFFLRPSSSLYICLLLRCRHHLGGRLSPTQKFDQFSKKLTL